MLGLRKSFHYSIVPLFHYFFALSCPRTSPSLYRERYRSAVAHLYPKQVFAFRFRPDLNRALVHGIILHGVESVEQQIDHDLLELPLSPRTGANPELNSTRIRTPCKMASL